MKIFADLHLHSKYSRATSRSMDIEHISKWAKVKGLNILGTGDFTHPLWLKELKQKLKEDGSGILKSEGGMDYILQAEISNIYSGDGKVRKIHNIILAPSFEIVEQVNEFLGKLGNLEADGRPIFGKMNCAELTENLKEISKDIHIIPAHAWTPWFSVFGSKSGFDSIEECFKDQAKHIFAIETGLSSDPEMNWRISGLDNIALISNSDSHSFWPWRLGRECNVFDLDKLTYDALFSAIKERDKKRFLFTIEVDPSYGKYHIDGHRDCNISFFPEETKKHNGICPKCGRPLTIGVLNRVEELADREEGYKPKEAIPFKKLIPVSDVIASLVGTSSPATKKVWEIYNKLIEKFGNEFNILLEAGKDELGKETNETVAEAILKNREGQINIRPGFDGEYGKPIFNNELIQGTEALNKKQKSLNEF